MKTLKSIDLFAGIGGIRMGFDRAFGDNIGPFLSASGMSSHKRHMENFHDSFGIAGDITQIKEDEIPEFDICLADFPARRFP